MSDMTNYLEGKLAAHALGVAAYTMPTSIQIGLFTADPTDTGSLTAEVSGGGYARQTITFSATGDTASNSATFEFPVATADWGSISHVGIFENGVDTMLFHPPLVDDADNPITKTVSKGDALRFQAGEITVTMS